jgi:hypothetical protein
MSRKNKVNPDHYKVAGRLSPDDLARERIKQSPTTTARAWDERPGQQTWMDDRVADPGPGPDNGAEAAGPRPAGTRKNAVTRRSAAAKPALNAARGTNKRTSVGRKKTTRNTRRPA